MSREKYYEPNFRVLTSNSLLNNNDRITERSTFEINSDDWANFSNDDESTNENRSMFEFEFEKKYSSFNERKVENSFLIAMEIFEGSYQPIYYKEYANFMGKKENKDILSNFILLLEPLPNSLLGCLYKLSQTIYLVAEAQNIDRILEQLSQRWIDGKPNNIFNSNFKICHIVLFSLLILNGDLHNDNNNGETHLTCVSFSKITLETIKAELSKTNNTVVGWEDYKDTLRQELTSYYEILKKSPLPIATKEEMQKFPRPNQDINHSPSQVKDRLNFNLNIQFQYEYTISNSFPSIKDSLNPVTWKINNGIDLPQLYLKEPFDDLYRVSDRCFLRMDSILEISEKSYIDLLNSQRSMPNELMFEGSSNILKRKLFTSPMVHWFKKHQILRQNNTLLESHQNNVVFLEPEPKWVKVRVIILEGRIFIFKLNDDTCNSDSYKEINDLKNLIEGTNNTYFFAFNLIDAVAESMHNNIILGDSEHSDQPTHYFKLTFPKRLKIRQLIIEFEGKDFDIVNQYVETINFWATRLSSIPPLQLEIVSSEEYGWSRKILEERFNMDEIHIDKWESIGWTSEVDNCDMRLPEKITIKEKLMKLKEYIQQLQLSIDKHNAIKSRLISRWGIDQVKFETVMNNWNRKYLFLNGQYERRIIYYNTLNHIYLKYIDS